MVNPFRDFQAYQPRARTIPLDRIIAARDELLERLITGYHQFLAEEGYTEVHLAELGKLTQLYTRAERIVTALDFTEEDIEDFCFTLERTDDSSSTLWGLSGLYLSALCNCVDATEITLRLEWLPTRVHLLGYGLPAGKRLIIEGHCGDSLGAALEGGEIMVQGSTANWTGIGLKRGKIIIRGNTGEHTGEEMRGGEVHIGGRIRSIGQVRDGKVYLGERLVAPVREAA